MEPGQRRHGHSQHVLVITTRGVGRLHDLAVGIRVEALVQPGFLELVIAHQPVPELMAELMHRHKFRVAAPFPRPEVGAHGDEGGILHAAGGRVARHIDDGHGVVRILAVPQAEIFHGIENGAKIAVGHVGVAGPQQECDFHVSERHLIKGQAENLRPVGQLVTAHLRAPIESARDPGKAGARRPGKVVDVLLVLLVSGSAILVGTLTAAEPGRGYDVIRRSGELDVVNPVVGVEFGIGVILVAIPAADLAAAFPCSLVDGDLGEPLRHQVVVAFVAAAGHGLG